jgi:hypothetical protein
VQGANDYLEKLAEPYGRAEKGLWAAFGNAVSQVNETTSNGDTAKLIAAGKAVISGVLEAIPGFGEAFKWGEHAVGALHVIVGLYLAGAEAAEIGLEPAESDFSVEAGELGTELTNRLSAAETEIRLRFRNIILADYGKLETVDVCRNPHSHPKQTCPYPSEAWDPNVDALEGLKKAMQLALQKEMYETLVPKKYPLALALGAVAPAERQHASNAYNWCAPLRPFVGTTGVYLAKPDLGFWISARADWLTPTVLTTGDQSGGAWKAASWTVFGRMFNKVDPGGELTAGGLGIDETKFMHEAYGVSDHALRAGDGSARFQPYGRYLNLQFCNTRRYGW